MITSNVHVFVIHEQRILDFPRHSSRTSLFADVLVCGMTAHTITFVK